jgi:hypothetical protein
MSSQVVTKEVQIVCGESKGVGSLSIHYFSPRERQLRALKTGAVCFAVLIVFACIPGAHIILVPVWLLIAPFLLVRAWRVPCIISEMNACCAQCQGELTTTNDKERYPIFETCKGCHRENRLVPIQ